MKRNIQSGYKYYRIIGSPSILGVQYFVAKSPKQAVEDFIRSTRRIIDSLNIVGEVSYANTYKLFYTTSRFNYSIDQPYMIMATSL